MSQEKVRDRLREQPQSVRLVGALCAVNLDSTVQASVEIANGFVHRLLPDEVATYRSGSSSDVIDLSGYCLLPGFVNAHDHLQFALHPRMGNPPYQNYVEWGEDIHTTMSDRADLYRSVPREIRLWWGGIRNLLCGVTTVCHHDKLWPELLDTDFPVKVVQQFGWAHSLALGGDLRAAKSALPKGQPFIMHACEGVDSYAKEELWELERLGILNDETILVHGLAVDATGADLLQQRGAALILCPSSNDFLFHQRPALETFASIVKLALGSDSPLTGAGDLLDEVRFAIHSCGFPREVVYRMVTTQPAAMLRLKNGEGSLRQGAVADLIAVRDTGRSTAESIASMSVPDVECVIVGGRVQLASEEVYERLPSHTREGLEALCVDGILRWLRAPVDRLLGCAEHLLGTGGATLSGRPVRLPSGSSCTSAPLLPLASGMVG